MTPTSAIEHLRQSRSDLHRQFAISSTNREHGRADFGGLWGAGFPDPVLGNTGNGTHLLYPVDLPNDSDKYALAKRPKKRPLLPARQETAGMTARARSTAKSWLKQEDYSNICAVTDQLIELTPPSSDRRTTGCSRAWS